MSDDLMQKLLQNPKAAPAFEVGQTVRVVSNIDVNFPKSLDYWLGAKCKVLSVIPRGFIGREWCYELEHPNGRTCEFTLDELDGRYRKRNLQAA